MRKHARDRRPHLPPVTRLELSEKNVKLRWIAIAVLLSIAVVAIGNGFSLALGTEPGWQEVTSTSQNLHCGADFKFVYDFSDDGGEATAQYKKLEQLYSGLTEEGYRLFSPVAEGEDNLYALNQRVNTPVTVAPGLYQALAQIAESDSRHPFLGPVERLYWPIFLSATDAEARLYDPMKNEDLAQTAREMAAYCADPDMISLEVLGDNQALLKVAPEYLAFAREYGIDTFLELGWMTNAFVVDFLADGLAEAGYTKGHLVSLDGFTRNLDSRGSYSLNLFDRQENDILMPGRLEYTGPMSIVSLRDYPLSGQDQGYYAYEDGTITTLLLDPADGTSKSATDTLVAYGEGLGCGPLLLHTAPLFTAETLDTGSLFRLRDQGIDVLWFEGKALCHTAETVRLTLLPESGGADYRIQ